MGHKKKMKEESKNEIPKVRKKGTNRQINKRKISKRKMVTVIERKTEMNIEQEEKKKEHAEKKIS